MTTISLKVPPALERRLRKLADESGRSRSEIIRNAVERFAAESSGRGDSCLTLASDLIGCVDGPADLSHNKKRLERFGR